MTGSVVAQSLARPDFNGWMRDIQQRKSAPVHKRERLNHQQVTGLGDRRLSLAELYPACAKICHQAVRNHEPDVMASLLILGTGITETGYQTDL